MYKMKMMLVFFFLMSIGSVDASEFHILCDGKSDVSKEIPRLENLTLNFSEGVCNFSQPLTLYSNVVIIGAGNNKTILMAPKAMPDNVSFLSAGSRKADTPVVNIQIKNLTLYGRNGMSGFSEHNHLLSLIGVKNVKILNSRFLGFQGDAIYIGRSTMQNRDIEIRNNYFDGLNYNNRNAVSVISGSNVDINSNFFFRTTMRNMPGAIDLEPNNGKEHLIENIKIANNKFLSIGGKAAVVVSIRHIYASQVNSITIENNKIYNTKRGIYIYAKNQSPKSLPRNFTINGNRILGAKIRPLLVCNIEDLKIASKNVGFNSYCPLTQRALSLIN